MPLEEIIGELILRPILELVTYGVFYWTGFLFLKGSSFGAIRQAPLSTTEEGRKTKWYRKRGPDRLCTVVAPALS